MAQAGQASNNHGASAISTMAGQAPTVPTSVINQRGGSSTPLTRSCRANTDEAASSMKMGSK
ncbi:hypothetical protein D9M68_895270 [compost metagenome]